jgi:xylitol oxidase
MAFTAWLPGCTATKNAEPAHQSSERWRDRFATRPSMKKTTPVASKEYGKITGSNTSRLPTKARLRARTVVGPARAALGSLPHHGPRQYRPFPARDMIDQRDNESRNRIMDGNGELTPARIGSLGASNEKIGHPAARTNWAGNVLFRAARVHAPGSIDDLRRIVSRSRQIRALGCGHSFSTIADTTGDLVHLEALPQTINLDSVNSTVTVSSAVTYTDLSKALHRAGFALANMASIPDISIAGACTTGTHGSGDDQCVLAASVAAIQLVGSDGDLVELGRDSDRDSFRGSVVSLGALGIVTQLTLDIEPTYNMTQRVYLDVPLYEIQDRIDDVFSAGYSVSVFTNWHSSQASVWVKRRVDQPLSSWTALRQAHHAVHPVPRMSPDLCTQQLGAVGPWHERLPHFRPKQALGAGNELQSEVFLPRLAAREAIAWLREMGSIFMPALLISEMRTVRSDDLWLSPAYGRDSVAFHFTWTDDQSAVLPALAAIEERLMPLDPRPHWSKLSTMAPREVIASYERARAFEQLIVDGDPTLKFRNGFVNGLFPTR